MVLIKNGAVATDGWTHLADEDAIPADRPFTVSWKRWTEARDTLPNDPARLGLQLPNNVAASEIGDDARRFGIIVLTFPNFGDGRAYSQASVLRNRYKFRGELRATGAVLRDQLLFMQRCGIDALEMSDRALSEDWLAALREFDVFYQPAADNRPWVARQRLLQS